MPITTKWLLIAIESPKWVVLVVSVGKNVAIKEACSTNSYKYASPSIAATIFVVVSLESNNATFLAAMFCDSINVSELYIPKLANVPDTIKLQSRVVAKE